MAKRTVVNTQMPSMKTNLTQAPGEYNKNHAPFDQPQSMGNGGVPTQFFSGGMMQPKTGKSQMSGPMRGDPFNGTDRPASGSKPPGGKK